MNFLSRKKLRWSIHQQTQLARLSVPGLKVAFPGSLLCNHILVPVSNQRINKFSVPDVSHVVYEYCNGPTRNPLLKGALVVDIDGCPDNIAIEKIVAARLRETGADSVVLLGQSANNLFGNAIRLSVGSDIEVHVYEPDWMSAVAMHSIYRQASSVLFINTMRVLDAVCTKCPCILVAGSDMQKEPVFFMMQEYLNSIDCVVLDQTGEPASIVDTKAINSYLVVNNSVSSVQSALRYDVANDSDDIFENFLNEVQSEKTVPVIKAYNNSIGRIFSGLRDKKTGIIRKTIKLCDDPGAFFSDSDYQLLRLVGRVWQKKTVNN